ncbi:MAG: Na+ dependent nucleoside transporter [Saprospiraceae bacterium]|nr:Na+ dependent nucleoside transporter [Saprospiraceae bacterium]
MDILRGLLGMAILTGILFLLSNNKGKINWMTVSIGIAMQIILAFIFIKIEYARNIFEYIVGFFTLMINSSQKSAQFLFGDLAKPGTPFGFAFLVLPTIIFFSALSSLLYYLGILQKIVSGFAWLMRKTLKLSGAESLSAAANVFIGQTEAPLIIKPYLETMTRSEILCMMVGGMATIAGSVFGAYMAMLGGPDQQSQVYFGMHLLTASVISAPAAIICAKILVPETEKHNENFEIPKDQIGTSILDSLSRGTTDGLKLAVNVAAMLLAFMAFVYLFNFIFTNIGSITGLNEMVNQWTNGAQKEFNLQFIMGLIFAPIAWIIGINPTDIMRVGQLLGEKTILNEFVAYLSLADMKNANLLESRSIIIAMYALCGFSNFASIGIQIGGISTLCPGQRNTLTEFGVRALIGGTVACLMTACVAGMIV